MPIMPTALAYKVIYDPVTGPSHRITVRTAMTSQTPINQTGTPIVYKTTMADFQTAVSQVYGLTMPGVPPSVTLCMTAANAQTTQVQRWLTDFGFSNYVYVDNWNVGDKIKFNNGNYYVITQKIIDNNLLSYIAFDAYTESGTKCYDHIMLDVRKSPTNSFVTVPIFPVLSAVENINSYNLQSKYFEPLIYSSYNEGRFNVDSGTSSSTAPITPQLGELFWTGILPVDEDDPYPDVPNSIPSGPAEGVGLPTSDEVDIPGLPSFSVTDTGFVTLFNPTLSQVKNLADYMWNGLFDVNNFKKIFADPMDCILGFNMVPVAVPSGAAANINIGNIVTSVSMNVATSQWVEVDCGSIDIGLPYGSYLDFSPYTKFSIYLPYIGTCELSADDVAGKVLTLKYHVDALSCACVAYLKCGDHVLYQWTGSCGYSIPVTQNDFTRMITTIVSIAAAGIGGAVVGGAGAAIMNAGAAAAKNVSALKPEVHRSGAIGSSAGLMGGQTPYLIIEIPQACKPEKQYHYTGYPGFITVTVGDLSGYAEFEEIILSGIGCTEEERSMIDSLCKGGIYV